MPFFSFLAGHQSWAGEPEWATQGPGNAPSFLPSLPKCPTAGVITLPLPAEERAPPRASLPPFGPGRPPTGYSSARTTDSPQKGRQGTESCIIFIFFIESSQCWAHSYCPQIVIAVDFNCSVASSSPLSSLELSLQAWLGPSRSI